MTFAKTVTDDLGRAWTVDITVSTLKRLAATPCAFSIDSLVGDIDSKAKDRAEAAEKASLPLRDFLDDTMRFAEVLFAIVKPEADKLGVTIDQFDEGFRGDSIQSAQEAFLQALHDFFRSPPKKMILRGMIEERKQMKILVAAGRKRMEMMLAQQTPEKLEKLANESIDAALSKSAIASPGPLGLTLTPDLSAN